MLLFLRLCVCATGATTATVQNWLAEFVLRLRVSAADAQTTEKLVFIRT